ncbi:MAG: DUF1330 domain-containing protein [Acidimicrobiia bacterium]|nr:DUF1330 domain-containing protein [Acidimicrobiia bacterium]
MDETPAELHGGEGGVNPTIESIEALRATHRDGPVHMINLLKFKDVASYPDGHEHAGSTGAEAYNRYGQVAITNVIGLGGRLVLAATFDASVIGDPAEDWDQIAIVEYPDIDAFFALAGTDGYLDATEHRTAGLERTRLIATTPVYEHGAD